MVKVKERVTRAAIEALEAQMRLDELEDRLHSLQIEREKRKSCRPGVVQDGDVMAIPAFLDDSEQPSYLDQTEDEGHSSYGRSRRSCEGG